MPRALTDAQIEAFRDKLCDIATQHFAELGYDGVTMRGLAKEAGCSPMTPYRYFSSKEEIFAAVRTAAFSRLSDACEAAAELAPDGLAGAGAISQAYFNFAVEEPQAYQIMFGLSRPTDTDHAELSEQVERSRSFFRRLTDLMIEDEILQGDPVTLGHIFWAGMHGVIVLHLTDKLGPGVDANSLLLSMLQTIALGAKGPKYDEAVAQLRSPVSAA